MNSRHRSPNELTTLKEEHKVVKGQYQVAQTFNDYFSTITRDLIVSKYTPFKEQSHVSRIPSGTNVKTNTFAFNPIKHHLKKAVLENIKPNKAQGYDLIPPRTAKALSQTIAKPLCDLINIIISRSQVPDT